MGAVQNPSPRIRIRAFSASQNARYSWSRERDHALPGFEALTTTLSHSHPCRLDLLRSKLRCLAKEKKKVGHFNRSLKSARQPDRWLPLVSLQPSTPLPSLPIQYTAAQQPNDDFDHELAPPSQEELHLHTISHQLYFRRLPSLPSPTLARAIEPINQKWQHRTSQQRRPSWLQNPRRDFRPDQPRAPTFATNFPRARTPTDALLSCQLRYL